MNHPSTLILPWGLKSWLVAVSRAVLLEEPSNVLAFIASYCGQLLQLKKEHPNIDIQELSYIFRDLRGGHSDDYQGTISFTGLAESVLSECSHKISEERDDAAPCLSASDTSSIHVHCEEPGHPAMEDDTVSSSVVQSAVYQRDPSVSGVVDVENTVLIHTSRTPSEHVIIVHSECLPETLIFHSEALPSSNGSPTTCDLTPAPSPVPSDEEWEEPEGVSSVVMFHKVPLFEDLPHPPSMGELPYVAAVETMTDEDISSSSDKVPSQENMSGTQSVQVFFSAASEVESSGQMRNSTSSFEDLAVDKMSDVIIPHKAPSYKELPQSTSPIKQTSVVSPEYSGSDITAKAPSETELVDAAQRVSPVRIPSREEGVGRTAETPERHTSPRVSPRASPGVSPQTSLVSAHVGESLYGTDISPQSSLPRIPSAPSMEELLVSPSASVGRISPAVSRRSSRSSLSERAPSESAVGKTAETSERHTSPRVSPQASSVMIDQVPNLETSERSLTTSTLHSEDFKFACISYHNVAHGTTQTEERPVSQRTTQTEVSALHRTTQTEVSALHRTTQTETRPAAHRTTQTEVSASPLPGVAAMEHQNPAEELGLGPSPAEDVTEVAEWVNPDNIETSKLTELVSPQHVENAPITELVSPQHVVNAPITELVGPQHVEKAPITELVSSQHVENAPISGLACPPHEEAVTFENPKESVETEENVETSTVEVTSKPQPEDTTNAPPCPGPETLQIVQEESATQTPEEESVQAELTTKTPEEESVQEELTTKTPEESFPRVPTPQFLLPIHTAEGRQQNRTKPANLIKMAVAERNHLIKRLAKSDPLKNRLDGSKSATRVREVSYATNMMKQRSQTAPQPNIKRMLNLTAMEEQQNFQGVPVGEGRITPDMDPARESSINKVWTLYHLAQETGNLSLSVLSQPSFNGRAYIESVDPEHVLLSKRTSHNSGLDSGQLTSGPTQGHSGQTVQTVHKLDTPDTQQIKIPNYLLVERSSATSDIASSQERKPADQESCVVNRGRCTGFLSFSVPIDSFCGAEWGCRPQFLQVTSDDGDVVYSPAFIQSINPCRPGADEVAERTDTRPTTSPAHMEWSFKISIKGQTVGDDEVEQEK
ncbi:uncharacterized protein LOC121534642 [Coregonus clupeaformis]|uniref:uncharacterized protein LOC121534642 n=1 Tax=Coregonus clupeaformis TaxID=59861 RepID=UPI001BDFC3DB|nr:uncharacterized protein LOC121534642 [Coregonus clupeaformis]